MGIKKIECGGDFRLAVETVGKKFVLFYSSWCPFCVMFAPSFEKHAAGRQESFVKVCTDSLPDLEDKYSIEVVPTVLCFSDGKLLKRLDGALGRGLTEEKLLNFVKACCEPCK